MRVAVGCFFQESHSFSPVPGSWDHFGPREVLRGPEILEQRAGTRTELGGAIDVARADGLELIPLLSATSTASSGPIVREVFETIRGELVERLRGAGAVDAVFLVLHGATVADGHEDAAGEVLRAVRAEVGPGVPIVSTLDLHANVTAGMAGTATALVGYHTFPHVDLYETGQRAMRLLAMSLAGRALPLMAIRRLPMILPGENGRTTSGPFAEVMQHVMALGQQPGILDASAFSVQPWLDVEDVGCSVVVIADGEARQAEQIADRIADEFWRRRRAFAVTLTPAAGAIRRALDSVQHPFVLSDSADSPSSGAPGDSPVVLDALLHARPAKPCYVNIVDPPAVESMIQAGVGQNVTLRVGAKYAPGFYAPIEVAGRVKLISDGEFVHKGLGFQGVKFYRGRTAVLECGSIYLVVMERPVFQWDPELYRSVGLEPRDAQIVVVKSPAAFRAAYEPLAAEVLILDVPGVCSPNLRSYPFERVRRPLYPLDEVEDWRVATAPAGPVVTRAV